MCLYLLTCISSLWLGVGGVKLSSGDVVVKRAVPSGAVRLHTPLLLPRNRKLYDGSELACFMDHSGMLVTLPYDLRVSSTNTHTHMLAHKWHEMQTFSLRLQSAATVRSSSGNPRTKWLFPHVIDYSDFTIIIISAPNVSNLFSLQMAFARFVARNNVTQLKR